MTRRPTRPRRCVAHAGLFVLLACSDPAAPPFVQTLDISGAPPHPAFIGTPIQLSATALDPQGNEITTLEQVWTSSDESVATVSATGLVTPLAPGDIMIRVDVGQNLDLLELPVRYGGLFGAEGGSFSTPDAVLTFDVAFSDTEDPLPYAVRPVTPPVPHAGIVPGTVFEITLPGDDRYPTGSGYITMSYDPDVVPDSLVTLYAFSESAQAWRPTVDWSRLDEVAHTLHEPIARSGTYALFAAPTASVVLLTVPIENRILVGGTYRVLARPVDPDGNRLRTRDVTWSTSDPSVMTVVEDGWMDPEDGYITGVAPGFATLTATIQGKEASVVIEVVPAG